MKMTPNTELPLGHRTIQSKYHAYKGCAADIVDDIIGGDAITQKLIYRHCDKHEIQGELRKEFVAWFLEEVRTMDLRRRRQWI